MMRLLVLVPNMSPHQRGELRDRLTAGFPELEVTLVARIEDATAPIASAEILMAYNIPDHLAAQAVNLRWIQSLASGTDGFLSRPSLSRRPMITRMQNVAATPVSESVLASMLALGRQLPALMRAQANGHWDRELPEHTQVWAGKTAGLLGVGQIAEALAPKLKALGMRVVGLSGRTNVAGFDLIRPQRELAVAVADFDVLIVLVPLRAETRQVIGAAVLAAMKSSAFLINVSRGALVDEAALINALATGKIAGAALDVFAIEPLPADSALWSLPNVIVTPHAAAAHTRYIDDIFPLLETNLRRYLAGDRENMINVVRRGGDG